jgi:hypothetical protein
MPLTILAVPTIGVAIGLLPLMGAIPAVGMMIRLMPPMVLALPTRGMSTVLLPLVRIPAVVRLMPRMVLALPTKGMPAGLLPLVRLTIPAIGKGMVLGLVEILAIHLRGKGPRLGPVKSLTIRLRDKMTIRFGLGAQGAKRHKQAHYENNAPPSFQSHFPFLLEKISVLLFSLRFRRQPRHDG